MAEQAAHLVDRVFPVVPVRQWVLTVPHWLRYKMAWDHELTGVVLGVFTRTVAAWYRARARRLGLEDVRGAAITQVQRFGDGLRLSPHFHTLFVDGVWSKPARDWPVAFYPALPPSDDDVGVVAVRIRRKIVRKLVKLGVVVEADDGSDAFADDEPLLALCGRASLMDRVAVGQRRGQLVATIRAAAPKVKPHGRRCAMVDGFSVHANTFVAKHARPQLEKLCRYITRPAVCNARLKRQRDGRVRMDFKSVWRNGATGKVFEPLDFIAKLVPLVAKPRVNLLRYHGQFAANAAWRSEICPGVGSTPGSKVLAAPNARARRRRYTWSELLRRCFAADVLRCRCGGRREVIAVINAGPVARKILRHLRLRTELPRFHPARGPPDLWASENGDARAFNPRDHFEAA